MKQIRTILVLSILLFSLIPLFSSAENQEILVYDDFSFVGELHNNRNQWFSPFFPLYNSTIMANGSHCIVHYLNYYPIASTSNFTHSIFLKNLQIVGEPEGESIIGIVLSDIEVNFQIGIAIFQREIYALRKIGSGSMDFFYLRDYENLEVINFTLFQLNDYFSILINEIEYFWEYNSLFNCKKQLGMYSIYYQEDLTIFIDRIEYLRIKEEIKQIDYYYLQFLLISLFVILFSLSVFNCYCLKYKNKYLNLIFLTFIPILAFSLFILEIEVILLRIFFSGLNLYINTQNMINLIDKNKRKWFKRT